VTDDEMPWAITSDSTGIYVAGGIYQDNESQYGWALLKLQLGGSIVNADTDYTAENNYYDNWLTSVKTTVGTGGRAYAAGWVDRNLTSSCARQPGPSLGNGLLRRRHRIRLGGEQVRG
jgi:hypothetical protein